MAAADVQAPPAETPGLPDYLLNPNAVLGDDTAKWRYGRAPDYSNTRKVYEETRTKNHEAASLPNLVENLVKNWEVEASFKPQIEDWRTIDRPNYTFAINGGPPQSAEHMLKVGTYNAIITPNDYYSPGTSDFDSSHKTFKRMMPTFAWEVLEVYSGPPVVAFRWRHWGVMKNDYVGFNDKGEKIRAKAHGKTIDIQGITVAKVDDKVRLQSVETWFDPLEMFRQIAPTGQVTRTPATAGDKSAQIDVDDEKAPVAKQEKKSKISGLVSKIFSSKSRDNSQPSSPVTTSPNTAGPAVTTETEASKTIGAFEYVSTPDAKATSEAVETAPTTEAEVAAVHGEMSGATPAQCPYLVGQPSSSS